MYYDNDKRSTKEKDLLHINHRGTCKRGLTSLSDFLLQRTHLSPLFLNFTLQILNLFMRSHDKCRNPKMSNDNNCLTWPIINQNITRNNKLDVKDYTCGFVLSGSSTDCSTSLLRVLVLKAISPASILTCSTRRSIWSVALNPAWKENKSNKLGWTRNQNTHVSQCKQW